MDQTIVNSINKENINYKETDIKLLEPFIINKQFNPKVDTIELSISNEDELIDIIYDHKNYSISTNQNNDLFDNISLYPDNDVEKLGFSNGNFILTYNFYKSLFNSSNSNRFYIKEISLDRTEIQITNLSLNLQQLQSDFLDFITKRNEKNFYSDFILNFGDDKKIIAVNVAINNNEDDLGIFIKLYEPLPTEYSLKDELWINEIISEPFSFNVKKEFTLDTANDVSNLSGPNFNIEINENISLLSPYLNIDNIFDISSSLNDQIASLKDNVSINIDFNEYNNFIHFSSAYERINNFIFKLKQIELFNNDIQTLNTITTGSIGNSKINLEKKISNIIQNLDSFEYFLYFESGSNSFPKVNDVRPYVNKPLNDVESLQWVGSIDEHNQYYGGKLLDSNNYDIQNRDYLWNNLPEYIRFDEQNDAIKLFTSMMGQHFDSIWVYIKDITNKNIADNRLDFGISKDLVAEALKSFGIKLYTNSKNKENIYFNLLGMNADGTFTPSTGSYLIENYITSSQYPTPENDINKEVYKRLYHNLPYLLKSKGTKNGLRALINCFGIPSTILNIQEFGGNTRENDVEYIFNKFNYSLKLDGNSTLEIPFNPSYKQFLDKGFDDVYPDSLEFRFKLDNIFTTQSILTSNSSNKIIQIENVDDNYANIKFGLLDGFSFVYSEPILLPLYNKDWWNVLIQRNVTGLRSTDYTGSCEYIFKIGNKNNKKVEYYESSSILVTESSSFTNTSWNNNDIIYLGGGNSIFPFNRCELQEFRYWIGNITDNDFKSHILNPRSISSDNELIFRADLGSELINIIQPNYNSIHYNQTESFYSFGDSSSLYYLNNNASSFQPNYEDYYLLSPNIGKNSLNSEKVKYINNDVLPDNVLSYHIKQKDEIEISENSNDLDVSISPQNIINNDIIDNLGYFNIDEYIGDPRDKSKPSYSELELLKNTYFTKYLEKSNITDIIKLLSYFDNSLFKMLKDFTPLKSNLITGLTIKSHILERNKNSQYEPVLESIQIDTNIDTAFISGTNSIDTNFISHNTKYTSNELGILEINSTDNKELFNGELPNSVITAVSSSEENIKYELNNNPEGILLDKIILNPTLNNVDEYVRNKKRLNVDYANDINTPININYLTESLIDKRDIPFLYSDSQEYNYSLMGYRNSKYLGSKLISKEYNKFTPGDKSFGNQPVIDNNKIKFAYFEEITSQSLTLPKRSNLYIKYLIDEEANITELSRQNKNVFDIQNIFNIDNVDILLDNNQSPSKQKQLDGLAVVFAGGFKYEPILQNLTNAVSTHNSVDFVLENDIQLLNDSNLPITGTLALNDITLGTPIVEGLIISPPLNDGSSSLQYGGDFKIKIPATRNTPYPGDINQKITGSISVKIKIKPFENFKTQFYRNADGTGISWELEGGFNSGWIGDYNVPGHPLFGAVNNIRSLRVPIGVKVIIANGNNTVPGGYDSITTYTTPGFKNTTPWSGGGGIYYPLVNSAYGIDLISITPLNTTSSFSLLAYQNDFGGAPTNNVLVNPFELDEEKEIILTFPIDGNILIPDGSINGNFYINKPNTNIAGIIKYVINITSLAGGSITSTDNNIVNLSQIQRINNPYYYTSPPEYLYITEVQDFGFNSGSSPILNWYFERENSLISGSFYNKLIGSYYLSNIIYDIISTNNSITQFSPDISILGYEQVENPFKIKVGDLMRFWNYDKESFPKNFENEVKNIILPQSRPLSGSLDNRFIIELKNEIPNQSCLDYYDSGSLAKKIQNFIILEKQPDETNIVIDKEKRTGSTSSGIILPSNINKTLKEKAGNIIKQLKSQNLI